MAVDGERHRNRFQHALGQGDGIALVPEVGHHEAKLVTAAPANRVTVAHLQTEPARNFNQHLIADRRPERVIDQTKTVEIEQDDRSTAHEAMRRNQRLIKPVGEKIAVGQAGQGIETGQKLDALGSLMTLRKIAENTDIVFFVGVSAGDRRNTQPLTDQRTILAPIGDFSLPVAVGGYFFPHFPIKRRAMHA